MTTFRYAATDLITGELLHDNLRLNVQSFSQQLNGGGSMTANLDLSQDYTSNKPYLEALDARRAVVWVLADGYPVWNGVMWDEPDMSRSGGVLPLSMQTMDSVFSHRLISATLEYAQVDIFGVFIDLVGYGTTKRSPYIATVSPIQGPSSALVGQQAAVAGLTVPTGPAALAGVTWNASYLWSDLTQVSSAFSDLVQSGNLEYLFQPGMTGNGTLVTNLRLAYATGLGRRYPQAGYAITYPGNASDYGRQITGSQSGNYIWASAPPNGSAEQWESQYPHGVDIVDLEAGYPLMESTVTWSGSTVTAQAQVNSFADGQLSLMSQGMQTVVINLPGGVYPGITDLVLGDVFPFAATSPRDPPGPNGEPGFQENLRLTAWTAYPPGPQQSEYVQLTASAILPGTI